MSADAPRPKTVLFAIVGVGAGNATRNLAITREMLRLAPETRIEIAAQGRSEEMFEGLFPLHRLRRVTYGESREFSAWNMVRSNLSFPAKFLENQRRYRELIRRLQPDAIVADSDFYCLGPARRLGVRLLSTNNSAYIVETFRRLQERPPGCGFSYRFIERTDYWLQRRYPDEVICPVLEPVEGLAPKFRQVPPIVREEFRQRAEPESDELVVMLGGSAIGADAIDLRFYEGPVRSLGPLAKGPPQTRQMDFIEAPDEVLRRARYVLIQGGFSSVSEALALGKPTIVCPIPGHAEQHVNALTVERLGLGIMGEAGNLRPAVERLKREEGRLRENLAKSPLRFDGAEAAARIVLGLPAPEAS